MFLENLTRRICLENYNSSGGDGLYVMSESDVAAYLAEHPRMTGVLFTALLSLTQAQTAMAAHGSSCGGP